MSDLAKCKAAHDMSQKTVQIHINNIVGKMVVKIMKYYRRDDGGIQLQKLLLDNENSAESNFKIFQSVFPYHIC